MFDFPTTPARSATRRWTALASVGLHAVVLVAVVTHPREAPVPTTPQIVDTFVWTVLQRQPVQQSQPRTHNVPGTARPAPVFRAPDRVPDLIPPPDLSQPAIDPRTLTSPVGKGPVDPIPNGFGPADSSGAAHDWRVVDQPPRLLSAGALEYPASLKGMGLDGTVRLRFVVDTTGRAMPETIEVVSSTHPMFIPAAKRTVTESRFEPGKMRGKAVRVMVEQTINYREG